MKNFKQLRIWQLGIKITEKIFKLTVLLPKDVKLVMSSQMIRAAISIPSNIAEGSSRKSEKEYARYLEIALGSCFELETLLQIMLQMSLSSTDQCEEILELVTSENKMIQTFRSGLNF
jgi:four helix bundle protein